MNTKSKTKNYIKKGFKNKVNRILGIFLMVVGMACMTIVMSGFINAYRIVIINDNSNTYKYRTLKTTTDNMLKEKNIVIESEDRVYSNDDGHNLLITIKRGVNVKVISNNIEQSFKIYKDATVADALRKANITLSNEDMVNVYQTQNVYENLEIVVNRVNKTDRVCVEAIAHGSEEQKTNNLYIGQKKFIGGGYDGEVTRFFKDTIVDGQVTQSIETGSRITKAPKNDIVLVGVKPRVKQSSASTKPLSKLSLPSWVQLDPNGIPLNFKNVMSGRATAYTGGGSTSTGKPAQVGYVAVNPSVIPYGTQMYIMSQNGYVYGYAIAADTGGAMKSGNVLVDLYMDSQSQCVNFGSRTVNIYIL